jgi:KipI family sensor histidine kinase inhibitor
VTGLGLRRLLPYGARGVLVELGGLDAALAFGAALRAADLPGVVDVVPAERSVLVVGDAPALAPALRALPFETGAMSALLDAVVELAVTYDGPDLDEVARLTGLDPTQVVAAHTGRPWTVAFGGFVPGFAYLTGGDPRLDVPRRPDPRTRVPAGAVALGGGYSGVYPRASPGGWQLIGHTDVRLWDPDRDPPALLRPGVEVRFVDAATSAAPAARSNPSHPGPEPLDRGTPGPTSGSRRRRGLEVLAVGAPVLVQDLGRPGMAAYGVARGGAADRGAHRLGQRLVANEEDAAGLEIVLGNVRLRAHGSLLLAVTGAPVSVLADGRPVACNSPFALGDGAELTLGTPARGLRTYLAVRGGIEVPRVLGSRSTDTLTGLGPDPVLAGHVLPVGSPTDFWPIVDAAPVPGLGQDPVLVTVTSGPRVDRLREVTSLEQVWTVSEHSDRVGVRLLGSPLDVSTESAPSEGALPGGVQVPPSGAPVIFGADCPVTGGHPVVAVVRNTDVLAQLRPGQQVQVRWARTPR